MCKLSGIWRWTVQDEHRKVKTRNLLQKAGLRTREPTSNIGKMCLIGPPFEETHKILLRPASITGISVSFSNSDEGWISILLSIPSYKDYNLYSLIFYKDRWMAVLGKDEEVHKEEITFNILP